MRTNIEIDDQLMKQAIKIDGGKTKKAEVEQALEQMLRLQRQSRIRELVGKVEFWDDVIEDRIANSVTQPLSDKKAA